MTAPLTFGSLFAGIGGLDLGLERAGMVCKFQIEIDDYCRRVLTKHWPDVPKYGDIREVTGDELERVDLLCGGFPCQDISDAGNKIGIDGARSGLWSEFARLIRVVGPRYVLVENVAALLDRGMGRVLGDLASLGFDAEWSVFSACAVGAPHMRERMFILAYRNGGVDGASGADQDQAGTAGLHLGGGRAPRRASSWWATEPALDSMVYGVPAVVDRLRPYGNAVVPQVAEWIGRRIVEAA